MKRYIDVITHNGAAVSNSIGGLLWILIEYDGSIYSKGCLLYAQLLSNCISMKAIFWLSRRFVLKRIQDGDYITMTYPCP